MSIHVLVCVIALYQAKDCPGVTHSAMADAIAPLYNCHYEAFNFLAALTIR